MVSFGLYRVSPFNQFLPQLVVKEEDVIFSDVDNVFELKHSLQNLEKRILAFFTVHLPDSKQSQTDQIRFRVRQNRYVLLTVLYQIFLNLPKSQSQGKPDEMRVSVPYRSRYFLLPCL
jgi:hypothetical protein